MYVIFTKIDKISKNALKELYNDTTNQIQKYAAAFPEIIGTSAHKKIGIELHVIAYYCPLTPLEHQRRPS